MNVEKPAPTDGGPEHYRSLQILDELSNNDSLTQRELSKRLGIALGLVNSYMKNLIAKGYITVKNIPPKRYTYYLTPKGFAEKTRLAYHLLQDYTRIYREAKNNLRTIFQELQAKGVNSVIFAGSDDIAEIAYITLQETSIKLAGVIDNESAKKLFFGIEIRPLNDLASMTYDHIIIATYINRETLFKELLKRGAAKKSIYMIFSA